MVMENNSVFQDSCVELFLKTSIDAYHNFEFNAIGTCLAASGYGKEARISLDDKSLQSIIRQPSLPIAPICSPIKIDNWSIDLSIPLAKIIGRPLSGLITRGNIYKCGDRLPEPHYLSLFPVNTVTPDFHRPEFFGSIQFE